MPGPNKAGEKFFQETEVHSFALTYGVIRHFSESIQPFKIQSQSEYA
jgi:hypothetical protein